MKILYFKGHFKFPVFLIVLFLFSLQSRAQRVSAYGGWGLGAYLGPLAQGKTGIWDEYNFFSGGLTYDLSEQSRLKFALTKGHVDGADANSPKPEVRARNLSFKSEIIEVALMGEYDLWNSGFLFVVPYIFGGPGIYHFNPQTYDQDGNLVNLHDIGTEGQNLILNPKNPAPFNQPPPYQGQKYSLTQLNINYGAGLKLEISENFSVAAEICYRQLFTNYLSDASTEGFVEKKFFMVSETDGSILTKPGTNIPLDQNPLDNVDDALFKKLAPNNYEAWKLSYRGSELKGPDAYPAPYNYIGGKKVLSYSLKRGQETTDRYWSFLLKASFRLPDLHIGKDLYYYSDNGYGNSLRGRLRCPKTVF